ncbi:MAG: hypothetical protein M1480_20390 [Bacteroidetes bacterium]|nr:hypothetical protein [Bacteroidota bacterium]
MIKISWLLLFICSFAYGQRANFFKEDITFRLDSIHFNVEGYYWFANNSDKPVSSDIFYPFPNSSGEKIDSIRLFNISAGQKTHYKLEGSNGISFDLFIAPHDTVLFQIGYRQELTSDSAEYILRTTQGWGKPLEHAEYKLIVPADFKIKNFSYQPDKSYNIENQKIYYWKMENFMPSRDMVFYF